MASRPRSRPPSPPPPARCRTARCSSWWTACRTAARCALSGGTAQLAIAEPVGSYTVAAQYTGDANYAATLAAAETSATLTVSQAATSTAVTPSTASVSFGQSATFTATVSSAAGAPPDGSVQFLVNGVAYGSPVALTGGTAQLAIAEPVGSYTVTAQYTGDTNYAATLAAAETARPLTVGQAATATAVTPGTASVSFGQSATFTATVSSAAGAPPDGSVQFLVDGVSYGSTVPLSGGTAQLAIAEPVGSYTVAAQYTGDANLCRDPGGRGNERVAHRRSGGDVHGRDAEYGLGQLWPVGHVHGHGLLRCRRAFGWLGAVPGQRRVLRQPGGTHRRHGAARDRGAGGQLHGRGEYTGDANYAATLAAAETSATLTVAQAATSTAVTPSMASVSFGQSATFTATVSSAAGAPSDGSVQFLVDGVSYGSPVPLSGGTAQLAIAELVGSYTVAAQYTGDTNYAATLAAAETGATLTVSQAATSTAVTPSMATVSSGESATFTATVSSANGAPPDGSVQFLVDGVSYGTTVPLSGGMAQLAIAEPAGSYTVAAVHRRCQLCRDPGGRGNERDPHRQSVTSVRRRRPRPSRRVRPRSALASRPRSPPRSPPPPARPRTAPCSSWSTAWPTAARCRSAGATAQLAIAEPAGSYTIAAQYTGDVNYAATLPAAETAPPSPSVRRRRPRPSRRVWPRSASASRPRSRPRSPPPPARRRTAPCSSWSTACPTAARCRSPAARRSSRSPSRWAATRSRRSTPATPTMPRPWRPRRRAPRSWSVRRRRPRP